jgi:hypothetical protein
VQKDTTNPPVLAKKEKSAAEKGKNREKHLTIVNGYVIIVNCITIACFRKELVKVQCFCYLQSKNFVDLTMLKM